MSPMSSVQQQTHFDIVEDELSLLGLTRDVFEAAIQAALLQYSRVTKFHPVTAGGSRFWEEVVAEFRRSLVTKEGSRWLFKHDKGLSITYLPDEGISVVVTSGNRYTGNLDSVNVRTKNAKGSSTLEFVGRNGDLFFDQQEPLPSMQKVDSHETWVLLYYIDKTAQEVRAELSLPSAMHQVDGKIVIDRWEKRIILPTIGFPNQIGETGSDTEQGFSDEIDFERLIQNE